MNTKTNDQSGDEQSSLTTSASTQQTPPPSSTSTSSGSHHPPSPCFPGDSNTYAIDSRADHTRTMADINELTRSLAGMLRAHVEKPDPEAQRAVQSLRKKSFPSPNAAPLQSAANSELSSDSPFELPAVSDPAGALPAPHPPGVSPSKPPLIPPAIHKRKVRAHSFAASLTPAQRALLFTWLSDEENTLGEIQRQIALPPPHGFGLRVNHGSLSRLRTRMQNTSLLHWVDQAMDTASDVLDPESGADAASLRETLTTLLYTRAVTAARDRKFIPFQMHQCVAAIERLEKIKLRANHPRNSPAPTARVHVDLNVQRPSQDAPPVDPIAPPQLEDNTTQP